PPTLIFLVSCAAVIPLAGWMGRATEALAARLGSGLGGLLNATMGNAAELIIAIMALRAGMVGVVQASITGSIIGNILFVMGIAAVAGGMGRERQKFSKLAAESGAGMMTLAVIALIIPAVFHRTNPDVAGVRMQRLSLDISVVLLVTYALGLWFSLRTHKKFFESEEEEHAVTGGWGPKKAIGVLITATVLISFIAEFLVGSVEETAHHFGLSDLFIGVIVVAIVGNAAEHFSAVQFAREDKMNLSLHIVIESSKQVALFVAPVLVFVGYALGQPMTLEFTPLEVVAVGLSVAIVSVMLLDGETNWLEGVQLLAVYAILGMAFYFA
ncbi:MAG: calcium/proton exchanger, partial [Planctomycetes bacterium]|nr:calcium/proton exchanger [Planctomycetota bacterium]